MIDKTLQTDEPTLAPAYHVPVLLKETVDGLDIREGGVYVDATFGGGGHSREILGRMGKTGHLYGFDQDIEAMDNIPQNDERFVFVRSNFRYLKNWMRYYDEAEVDGVMADLGVSSHHFDDASRGFSFRFDAPLDMRMNNQANLTAADVVNTYDEAALARIFYLYGELKNGKRLASTLVAERAKKPVETVENLLSLIRPLMGRDREKKDLAKVFQALRIEVNHEMSALEELLNATAAVLRPGGRLVVLTYHSLEDRMVKNFMRSGNVEGKVEQDFYGNRLSPFRPLTGKPVVPSEEEQQRNPRSRSAKLRVAEKIEISPKG